MSLTTFTIIISSAPSTAVTYDPPVNLVAPVSAGTDLGPITVEPFGWSGSLTISGADAASFSISILSGGPHLVAASQLTAGSFTATITATP